MPLRAPSITSTRNFNCSRSVIGNIAHHKANTTLFLGIAPIETVVDQHEFSGRPENSIRSHLDLAFKKKGWPWPSHPIEWKHYFMEYHMELLFGNGPRNAPEAPEEE